MMDKKLIEKYLKIYPQITDEIDRLDSEIKRAIDRKHICQEASIPEAQKKPMLESIEETFEICSMDYREAILAKCRIDREMRWLSEKQKKIIELRFWKEPELVEWSEVAKALNFHRSYVERIYRKVLREMIS